MSENTIVFQPMGRRELDDGSASLLALAQRTGVGIEASCGGKGRCGNCKIKVKGKVSPLLSQESAVLGPNDETHGYRLACQTHVCGPATVWVPESSRLQEQVILTTGYAHNMALDTAVRLLKLTVSPAEANASMAAHAQILDQLARTAGFGAQFPWQMSAALRSGLDQKLTAACGRISVVATSAGRILDVSPGWDKDCLGLAVDLGTTTIVVYLSDLTNGRVLSVQADINPQVSYSEDVIGRLSLCLNHPGGLAKLGDLARQRINRLAHKACGAAGVATSRIFECVVVGNTAMHHIFLGLDPAGLAVAPYTPATSDSVEIQAPAVALNLAPQARVHVLPVKSGFVGADAVAMALALEADQVTAPTLMVDLGTNGELILATPDQLLCCSCAAGPAFEGGHIKWGMRGSPGAVDGVSVATDRLTPTLSVIGGGPPLGICGSGLVMLASELVKTGAITEAGGFNRNRLGTHLRQGSDGVEYLLAPASDTGTGQDLVLTHQDLSQLQLAKAAIHAGISLMMAQLGVARLDRVLLAGAFGNYLDPAAACGINMFPGVMADNVHGVGNAAGAGAIAALLNRSQRLRSQTIARRMGYLELAAHPGFKDAFVEGMCFR